MEIFKKLFAGNPDKKRTKTIKKLLYSRMHPNGSENYEESGEALKEYRGEELTNMVREYMNDTDEVVRSRACDLLSAFCNEGDKSVIPDLISGLYSNSDFVQRSAVKGLEQAGVIEAVEPIINAVDNAHLSTYTASDALKKIDPKKASEVLRDKLEDSPGKYDWASMLVSLEDVSAVPLMKKYLDQGVFDAYDKRFIEGFVDDHPEMHAPAEKQTCKICGKKRPVTEMKGAEDKWFCAGECWKKRGTVLPTGIGTDCPLFKEGLCTAGDSDSLCSLMQGHYATDCHVYEIHKE